MVIQFKMKLIHSKKNIEMKIKKLDLINNKPKRIKD